MRGKMRRGPLMGQSLVKTRWKGGVVADSLKAAQIIVFKKRPFRDQGLAIML